VLQPVVELTLVVSESVSDFTPAREAAVQQAVADIAGVALSAVTLLIESASVRITATVRVATQGESQQVAKVLTTSFNSASAASSALDLTVQEVPRISAKEVAFIVQAPYVPAPSPPLTLRPPPLLPTDSLSEALTADSSSGSSTTTIIIAVVASIAGLACVVCLIRRMRSRDEMYQAATSSPAVAIYLQNVAKAAEEAKAGADNQQPTRDTSKTSWMSRC